MVTTVRGFMANVIHSLVSSYLQHASRPCMWEKY